MAKIVDVYVDVRFHCRIPEPENEDDSAENEAVDRLFQWLSKQDPKDSPAIEWTEISTIES